MRIRINARLTAVFIGVLVLTGLSWQSLPAAPKPVVVVVGTCLNASNTITTIQAGVTAAPAGATVEVCPGVYPEQVTISEPLTLTGIQVGTSDAVIIIPPAGGLTLTTTRLSTLVTDGAFPEYYQILITATTGNVNLNNLTVDGSGNNLLSDCSTSPPTLMAGFTAVQISRN